MFIILVLYLLAGLSTLVFSTSSHQEWLNQAKVSFPFVLQAITFFAAVYMGWDMKFLLISLSHWTEQDLEWSKGHLAECITVTRFQLQRAYTRIERKEDWPTELTSSKVFGRLRQEVDSAAIRRVSGWNTAGRSEPTHSNTRTYSAISDTTAEYDRKFATPTVNWRETESTWEWVTDTGSRGCALVFGWFKPYWLLNLLWKPTDMRGFQFRLAFRIFVGVVYFLELLIMYFLLTTTLYHNHIQGHIDISQWKYFSWILYTVT